MLRLVDGPVIEREAEAIAATLRRGDRVALRCGAAADQVVAATARALGEPVVIARVPAALDQVARTVLELAHTADPSAVVAIDEALRHPDGRAEAISLLDGTLRGRRVVVERVENLFVHDRDEVASALLDQRQHLTRWVLDRADLVSSQQTLLHWRGREQTFAPTEAPVRLQNGAPRAARALWSDYEDVRAYELALQLEAVGGEDEVGEALEFSRALDADSLRGSLWDALPEGVTALLKSLAVHGRPIDEAMLPRLPGYDATAYERGTTLALWRARGGSVVVDPAWTDWCFRTLARAEVQDCRRDLAETFAREVRPDDPSSHRGGLFMLEAARLFISLGEVDRALPYARHGVELVVGHARELSANRRYKDASAIYERLLLPPIPLSTRLRGYVKHYLHYNRAHARPELEPVVETARGYEASLTDWPENAIFWSRATRAWFLAGEPARARNCLLRARQQVPSHRDKDARLIARTARRLAELGHPLEAIDVLDGYAPDTARAEEDVAQLTRILEIGWEADRLEVAGAPPLALHRRERFRIVQQQGGWRFLADRLGRSARCATPIESARAFLATVSDEVRRLLRAFDRDLDDEERERKHTLLAMIDLIASGLDAPGSPTTWVYGRLERGENDALWLVSGGNLDARYEVPPALAADVVVGDHACLAEVVAGPSGVPRGPVVRLETLPRRDRDAVWQAWRERLQA